MMQSWMSTLLFMGCLPMHLLLTAAGSLHILAANAPQVPIASEQAQGNTAPLKTFVHEVLHCSRTSCSVLQTSLCYIEALCTRIPELIHQEQTGEGMRGEVDHGAQVLSQDDPHLLESPKEVDIDELINLVHFASSEGQSGDDAPPTVRMLDDFSTPPPL
jgi:hypothetical protein